MQRSSCRASDLSDRDLPASPHGVQITSPLRRCSGTDAFLFRLAAGWTDSSLWKSENELPSETWRRGNQAAARLTRFWEKLAAVPQYESDGLDAVTDAEFPEEPMDVRTDGP